MLRGGAPLVHFIDALNSVVISSCHLDWMLLTLDMYACSGGDAPSGVLLTAARMQRSGRVGQEHCRKPFYGGIHPCLSCIPHYERSDSSEKVSNMMHCQVHCCANSRLPELFASHPAIHFQGMLQCVRTHSGQARELESRNVTGKRIRGFAPGLEAVTCPRTPPPPFVAKRIICQPHYQRMGCVARENAFTTASIVQHFRQAGGMAGDTHSAPDCQRRPQAASQPVRSLNINLRQYTPSLQRRLCMLCAVAEEQTCAPCRLGKQLAPYADS